MFGFRSSKRAFSSSGAIGHLLESLGDKDEVVRVSIEHALTRICERRPNETLDEICEYKQKSPKLPELQTAILLRFVSCMIDEIDVKNRNEVKTQMQNVTSIYFFFFIE